VDTSILSQGFENSASIGNLSSTIGGGSSVGSSRGGISLDFSAVNSIDSPKPEDMTSVEISLSLNSQIGNDFSKFFIDTTQNDAPGSIINSMAGMSGQTPAQSVDTMCW
jgi:hypothetical protein